MIRAGRVLVIAMAIGLASTGCGTGGPVTFGTVEPSDDKLDISADATGQLVSTENWPNACDLLTGDEIESVLPQAGVDSTSADIKFIGGGETRIAPDGQCEYQVSLPGTTSSHPVQIWVELKEVGDPSRVASEIDNPSSGFSADDDDDETEDRKDLGGRLGPEQCYESPADHDVQWTPLLTCRQGPVGFSINAVTGGKVDIRGGGGQDGKTRTLYTKAIKQLPKAIAAKLPSSG